MLKKILIGLLVTIMILTALAYMTGNGFIITAVQKTYLVGYKTANVNDHNVFETRKIVTGAAQNLSKHPQYNTAPFSKALTDNLERNNAIAYLVLKDGQILSEHYFKGYTNRSKTNSFSMAKTVLTLMVGIAIEEGHIESFEQSLTDFIPEFKSDPLGSKATLANLSLMNSGYEWTEKYYSPFSPTVKLYYGPDVESFLLEGKFSAEPGSYWEYSSASTQLLAIALLRSLQKQNPEQTLSNYLSNKLWLPLGMNDDALWHTDEQGLELTYCCLNTNARNYAKLGQLMLNNGQWNERQLVAQSHIKKMIQPDGHSGYGYSTWLSINRQPSYYWFSGHLGQYIIVIPEHNTVIVKLGEARETIEANDTFRETELPTLIQETIKTLPNGG